ncbi:MAG TPA: DsbA family protein [Anaerolineales bacterium]|jgi:predicted DsbA family dithiol-disulfide isomerase|nr:DsbA family protein [Anaerolineales bacterium]
MDLASTRIPELWEWAEYYCPWCYVAAVRLHKVMPEYQGRVKLRQRAFPLELYGGGPPDRNELELEIWLAAMQEPEAVFKPFKEDWPTTTLPAFEGAWCAFQQDELSGHDFDLRIRRAFFAEGRNIGKRTVILELAQESGLDMDHFTRLFNDGQARTAVLEEGRLGKEIYKVRSTPTVMLADGKKLRHRIAYPNIQNGKILSVGKLSCCGEECYEATRALFEQVLEHEAKMLQAGE